MFPLKNDFVASVGNTSYPILHNVKFNHQGSLWYDTNPNKSLFYTKNPSNHHTKSWWSHHPTQNFPIPWKMPAQNGSTPTSVCKTAPWKVREKSPWLGCFFGCFSRPNKYRDLCDIPELSSLKFSPEIFLMKNNAQNAGEKDVNGWCMYFTEGQKRREEISLKKTTKTALCK